MHYRFSAYFLPHVNFAVIYFPCDTSCSHNLLQVIVHVSDFLPARRSKRGTNYGNVAGWVAGWVAVTLRYCIKTAKSIRKLFRPSERPMTVVS